MKRSCSYQCSLSMNNSSTLVICSVQGCLAPVWALYNLLGAFGMKMEDPLYF